jgi:dihydrofolate reductase
MRKLKLQMQISVDGFVCGPNSEMDWLTWNWDDGLKEYVMGLTAPVDTIVIGRKLAEGFIPHWTNAITNPKTDDIFARKMVDTPKVVFSNTLHQAPWDNTTVVGGDIAEQISKLKSLPGRDIITYGGAGFSSNLIEAEIIDDLFLFVNPTAIGKGLPIFKGRTNLRLVETQAFECGIVLHHYQHQTK